MPPRAGWLAPAGLALLIGACAGPAGPARAQPGPPRLAERDRLEVRRNGRGCEQTFGAFTISQIGFDLDGRLVAMVASLIQHCELPDGPALDATVTYRAGSGA